MRLIPLLLLLPAASIPLRAQAGPYPDLLADWQRNRTAVLAYIDAMPDSATGFHPTPGVRTFAQQVKHVAAVNYLVFATVLGEKPPVDTGEENGPASIKSKAEITKFLRDSFAYGHRALATLTPENSVAPIDSPFGKDKVTRLGMATLIIGHCFDHYGQMVLYLRMNGIVPPASRK